MSRTKKQKKANATTIYKHLVVSTPQRSTSDIGTWRNAIKSADRGRVNALYQLYDDLLIDTTLSRAWEKRVEAIANAELTFQFDDGTVSDEINLIMQSMAWETLLLGIMQRKAYGRSAIEIDFSNTFDVQIIPPSHIALETKSILYNVTEEHGYNYEEDPNIIVLGKLKDYGLFLKTSPYAIWKRGGFGDYAQWLEIFGMPQRVGKYSSYDPQSRIILEQAMQRAGSAPWMVIPKETEVETVNNTGNGSSGSSFNEFRQACNEEMLISILGQTLTTIAGTKGARSLGDVHKEVEASINQSDLRFVERVLNTYLIPLFENHGIKALGGRFIFPSAKENLSVSEVISLSQLIDIPSSFIRDKYGIPAPTDNEEVVKSKTDAVKKETEPATKEKKDKEELSDRSFILKLFDFFVQAPTAIGANRKFNKQLKEATTITLADDYSINVAALFNKALKEIYKNKGKELINKHLFDISNTTLQNAIDPILEDNTIDRNFKKEFKKNTAAFSAFKNHQQTQEIASLLTDENGKIVPFYKFKKEALKLSKDYNVSWLQTEYNTAVRAAMMARNLKNYEKTAHLYPNLEYVQSNAVNPRDTHLTYVGTILPIKHEAWSWLMPPSAWNCDCSVKPTDKEETGVPQRNYPFDNVFDNNPAETASFINIEETPYYKHTDDDVKEKVRARGLELFKEYEDSVWDDVYLGKKGGWLKIIKQEGKEYKKNLSTYKILADDGGKYELKKVIQGQKNPDAYNVNTDELSDAKHPELGASANNSIQNNIKKAIKQGAKEVVFRFSEDVSSKEIRRGIINSFRDGRSMGIKTVIIIRYNRNPIYLDVEKIRARMDKPDKNT